MAASIRLTTHEFMRLLIFLLIVLFVGIYYRDFADLFIFNFLKFLFYNNNRSLLTYFHIRIFLQFI